MRHKLLAAVSLCAVATLTSQARADTLALQFSGGGVFTSIELSYHLNPNTGPIPSTGPGGVIVWPNPVDPVGSYVIDSVTGIFSDSDPNLPAPIVDAAILGLVAIHPENPAESNNYLVPHSFSAHPVPHFPTHNRFTYDNLLYAGGSSPQTASSYPRHGGYFDIYGLLFTIDGGDVVDLWSAGGSAPGAPFFPPTYGVAVDVGGTGYAVSSGISVPEPGSFWLLGAGLIGMLAWRRSSARV